MPEGMSIKTWACPTIPKMVDELRRTRADDPGLVFRNGMTTFGEMADLADSIAMFLIDRGLKPGDRVALMLPPSDIWASIHYGVIAAGCVVVPINLAFKGDELRFVFGQSKARFIIAAEKIKGVNLAERIEDVVPALAAARSKVLSTEALPALEWAVLLAPGSQAHGSWRPARELLQFPGSPALREELDRRKAAQAPQDSCAIVYTSGSTSFPKPALLHHEGLIGGAWWYGEGSGIQPDERIMGFAPTFHVSGISAGMMVPHVRGLPIWLLDGFDPVAALNLIEKQRITMFSGFDTTFASLLRHPAFSPERVTSVRSLRLATGPAMYERVLAGFPNVQTIARCYAMTETCGPSAVSYPHQRTLQARKYSNGVPVPGMEIRIADLETGQTVGTGKMGEIRLKGPALFNGYLDMETETRAAFDEGGWFRTGDVGHFDDDGLLFLGGRLKRMIKTGGENVSEREVEIFLEDKVKGVSLAQVVGIPDPLWGEAVIAFVEPLPEVTLSEASLRNACKEGLANFKVPKRVFLVEETDWPRNDVGKISKDTLIARAIALTGDRAG